MTAHQLDSLLAKIDAINAEDPNRDIVDGTSVARELRYAQRLTEWVLRLAPAASEALRLAARGQHIARWRIPRAEFPMTRAGYLKWRERLKHLHADLVEQLMREAGYDAAAVDAVRSLILKRRPAEDPEMQALEDALCLLFLEAQLADLRQKTPDDTMREVIRKTWQKMSPRGRDVALQIPLPDREREFLRETLAS